MIDGASFWGVIFFISHIIIDESLKQGILDGVTFRDPIPFNFPITSKGWTFLSSPLCPINRGIDSNEPPPRHSPF